MGPNWFTNWKRSVSRVKFDGVVSPYCEQVMMTTNNNNLVQFPQVWWINILSSASRKHLMMWVFGTKQATISHWVYQCWRLFFSNSLTIHQQLNEGNQTIDFCDFIFSLVLVQIENIYIKNSRQCLTTFPKTLNFFKKYFAARRIFSSLLRIWKRGQTRPFVGVLIHYTSRSHLSILNLCI